MPDNNFNDQQISIIDYIRPEDKGPAPPKHPKPPSAAASIVAADTSHYPAETDTVTNEEIHVIIKEQAGSDFLKS